MGIVSENCEPIPLADIAIMHEIIVKSGEPKYNEWLAAKGFPILDYPYVCIGRLKAAGPQTPVVLLVLNSNGTIVKIPYCPERFDITPETV